MHSKILYSLLIALTAMVSAVGAPGSALGCLTNADCDDGISCTADLCVQGICQAKPRHSDCDDDLFCNGIESCSPTLGCVQASEPPCTEGFCNEEANLCRTVRDDLNTDFFIQNWGMPTDEVILELVPMGAALDFSSSRGFKLRAHDGMQNLVGEGEFALFPEAIAKIGTQDFQGETEDSAVLSIDWLSGEYTGPQGSKVSINGVALTANLNGQTASILKILDMSRDREAMASKAARTMTTFSALAPSSSGSQQFGGGAQIPPAYSTDICFDEWTSGWPSLDSCGHGYCSCLSNTVEGSGGQITRCFVALSGIPCLLASGGQPLIFLTCILRAAAGTQGCLQVIQTLAEESENLVQCKVASDNCYCNDFPIEYGHLCDSSDDRPLRAQVTGLRQAEAINITAACKLNGQLVKSSSRRIEFHNQTPVEIERCDPAHEFELFLTPDSEAPQGGVMTPSILSFDRRLCTPTFHAGIMQNVPEGGRSFAFDCTCQDIRSCPTFSAYGRVEGWPEGEDAKIFAQFTVNNRSDGGRAYSYFLSSTITGDTAKAALVGTLPGGSTVGGSIWKGSKMTSLNATGLPDLCTVIPKFTQDQAIFGEPGSEVEVFEVKCENAECQENPDLEGCEIDFRGSLTGDIRPVAVEFRLAGEEIQATLSQGSQSIVEAVAGDSFKGVLILNPIIVDERTDLFSQCTLSTPRSGSVPSDDPFLGIQINCVESETLGRAAERPRPPSDPFDWSSCEHICEPGVGGGSTTVAVPCLNSCIDCGDCFSDCLCFSTEVTAKHCPIVCEGNPNGGPSWPTFLRPAASVTVGGGDPDAGDFKVDDLLTLRVSATDEDGIQGVVVGIDGDYVEHVSAGGHTQVTLEGIHIDTSNLAAGPHTLEVFVLDNNPIIPGPTVVESTFEVKREPDPCAADTQGPSVVVVSPTHGAQVDAGAVDFRADISDSQSSVAQAKFYVDGVFRHRDSDAPYHYNWSATPGLHTLKVQGFDSCGNIQERQVTVEVLDPCSQHPLPTIQITNFQDDEWLEPELYTVEAQVTDPGGLGIDRVEFEIGSFDMVTTSAPWESNGAFMLQQGPWPITARVFDSCGRSASHSLIVNISENASVCSIDPDDPAVWIVDPTHDSQQAAGLVNIQADADDYGVLLAGVLEVNGVAVDTVVSGNPSRYQWNWPLTSTGDHMIRVRAVDVCMKLGFSEPVKVSIFAPQSFQLPADEVMKPTFRLLDGQVHPPGPPVSTGQILDLGLVAANNSSRQSRPFSFINDGPAELVIHDLTVEGTGFSLNGQTTLPIVAPPFGEATFQIVTPFDQAGVFEATLTAHHNAGEPFTATLRREVVTSPPSFEDDFESGDLSLWNIHSEPASASSRAAFVGSFGLRVEYAGVEHAAAYVRKNFGQTSSQLRARFLFDPRNLEMQPGDGFVLTAGYSTSDVPVLVVFKNIGGMNTMRLVALEESGPRGSAFMPVPDQPMTVDLQWQAGTNSLANGSASLTVVNGQRVELTDLDNSSKTVNKAFLGAVWGIDAGTTGQAYFDEVMLWY